MVNELALNLLVLHSGAMDNGFDNDQIIPPTASPMNWLMFCETLVAVANQPSLVYMRRSPTGVNNRWHFRKAVSEINIANRVIEGAEKNGVHAISRNFVFLELQRITGF